MEKNYLAKTSLLFSKGVTFWLVVIYTAIPLIAGSFGESAMNGFIGSWFVIMPETTLQATLYRYANYQKAFPLFPVKKSELSNSLLFHCLLTAAACAIPFPIYFLVQKNLIGILFFFQLTLFLYEVYLIKLLSKKTKSLSGIFTGFSFYAFLLMLVEMIMFFALYYDNPIVFQLIFAGVLLLIQALFLPMLLKKAKKKVIGFFYLQEEQ